MSDWAASVSLEGIEPGVHPDHLGLDLGVHATSTQGEGVDVAEHLGDGEGSHEADDVGLGRHAGQHAGHVGVLVEAPLVVAQVGRGLEAGGVLEEDLRVIPGDLLHRVSEAEGGGEDELVALGHEVPDDSLGVRSLGDLLDVGGLHLVAEPGLDRLAAEVVGVGPAGVADGAHVDEADLEGLDLGGRSGCGCGRPGRLALRAGGQAEGHERREGQVLENRTAVHGCDSLLVVGLHEPGWNVLPRDAGMLSRIQSGSREMRTRTKTVER